MISRISIFCVASVLGAGACGHAGRSPADQGPPALLAHKLALEAGDNLFVDVFGEKDLSGKFQVSEQGTIDYPLVGRLEVAGLTPPQVATLLSKKLADGYLKSPQVRVLAEGYQSKKKVYVWGQVTKSGTFNYTGGMTLIEALTLAGGLTPLANRDGVTVARTEDGKIKKYRLPMDEPASASYRLKPGDVIFVPERVF